ncbi:hypothetical protein [Mucilaginibacter pedocola]|uniref:Uncharacterized protein n=1 Tax=Mucilaginibacter pedocola TaxID=1792845 RepID=A0A1S9PFP2_9SPHI|nr:hypothetical protein [Mucilaginibacter pedocola]OOQ59408.1 hypothetical protein BC343_04290 [Mucilaginibacter pedocola]
MQWHKFFLACYTFAVVALVQPWFIAKQYYYNWLMMSPNDEALSFGTMLGNGPADALIKACHNLSIDAKPLFDAFFSVLSPKLV